MSSKGYKHTEEAKKRIGKAASLNKVGDLNPAKRIEVREKIRKTLKEHYALHPVSESTRAKLGKIHIGNTYRRGAKMSDSAKHKISEAFKGEKSYLWRGGISIQNEIDRLGVDYRIWRSSVFERDKYLCQMPDCDKHEHDIEAHHIKTFSSNKELRLNVSNGITLCKLCHNKTKRKESSFETLFTEIIRLKLAILEMPVEFPSLVELVTPDRNFRGIA